MSGFTSKRDDNYVPAIFGVSSVDLKTPTAIKVNPTNGAMLIDAASLETTLDTRYIKKGGDSTTGNYIFTPDGTATDGILINPTVTDPTVAKNSLDVIATFTPSANTSQRIWGLRFSIFGTGSHNFSDNNSLTGLEGFVSFTGSGSMGGATGLLAYAQNTGSGTLTNGIGILAFGNSVGSGSIITNSYAIKIQDANGLGTVTNDYGLYINAINKGTTLNYAIFTNVGAVRLGDNTAINGSLGVQINGSNTSGFDFYVNGMMKSESRYVLGGDMSFIPISGNQSVITTYWGLQLVGNQQGDVNYGGGNPSAVGNKDDANVIIPIQQAAKVGVIIVGASSQSGNLEEWKNSSLTKLAAMNQNGKISIYNSVNTAGQGVPSIYGQGRSIAQTAAVASVATYTVGSSDSSFIISANANITAFVAGTFNVTVAYTDETNTAQTLKLNFSSLTGTIGVALAAAGPFEGIPAHIRCKASTTITIATSGTFTNLTYNVEGVITQIA